MALNSDGIVFSWGEHKYAQCGQDLKKLQRLLVNNEEKDHQLLKPKPIPFFLEQGLRIKKICCGSNHSFAITSQDTLYAWGNNSYGQCGSNSGGKGSKTIIEQPEEVAYGAHANVNRRCCRSKTKENCLCTIPLDLAAGENHSLVLMADRATLYTFGYNQ